MLVAVVVLVKVVVDAAVIRQEQALEMRDVPQLATSLGTGLASLCLLLH